jgi:hypothetical protein
MSDTGNSFPRIRSVGFIIDTALCFSPAVSLFIERGVGAAAVLQRAIGGVAGLALLLWAWETFAS